LSGYPLPTLELMPIPVRRIVSKSKRFLRIATDVIWFRLALLNGGGLNGLR
jgi:hypothetical protein